MRTTEALKDVRVRKMRQEIQILVCMSRLPVYRCSDETICVTEKNNIKKGKSTISLKVQQ